MQPLYQRSHNTNLVCNLEGIMLLGKDNVCLLFTSWCNHSVYLADFDWIEVLACLLNIGFGGALVNNKDESVVIFNCLDCTFGASWVFDNGVLVPCMFLLDTVWNSFGLTGKSESLWKSECDLGPGLCLGSGMNSLLYLLCSLSSLKKFRITLHLPILSFISS